MKITFIGQLYSNEESKDFLKRGWRLDNAADSLQKLIISGFEKNDNNVDVISFPRVPSYPKGNKVFFKTVKTVLSKGTFTTLGFINIPLIKHISKAIVLTKLLRHSDSDKNDVGAFIIYSLHSPLLLPLLFQKNLSPTILIVPDLPAHMSGSKSLFYRIGKKIDGYILKKCLKKIHGFVFLTTSMNEVFNQYNVPWTLVEGICNDNDGINASTVNNEGSYILYTGSLDRRYGILNLAEAFFTAEVGDVKLIICGKGDAEIDLIKYSQNNNIVLKGQVSREESIALQRNALLLINPRTSEGEFTKFSFPSKTMEYLASGRPTLMYQLPGIPEEYYQYFFSPDDESVEALRRVIEQILQMKDSDLNEFGLKARDFVLSQKNSIVQTNKILNLIKKIDNIQNK